MPRTNVIPLLLTCLAALPACAQQSKASVCGSGVALPMQMERTGHASVRVALNGVEARLLVDTGANVSTLDITEGERFRPVVVASPDAPPGHGRAELAVSVGSHPLGTQPFSVMDLHFINIPSKRYGTEPFAGQLGAQFFIEHHARIDFANMVVCLAPSP